MIKSNLISQYNLCKSKPMLATQESFDAFKAKIEKTIGDDDFNLTGLLGDDAPYEKVGDIAIIDFIGFTVNSASPLEEFLFGCVSLQGFQDKLEQAVNDETINKIICNFDSGGGFIMGLPETNQTIQELKEVKPIYAYTSGLMCSAAYEVAVNCSNIIASPSAWVGNVGVLSQFVTVNGESISKDGITKLNDGEVTVTTFQSGTEKTIGNPYVPFTPEQEADILAHINQLGADFRALVNKQRGGVADEFLQGKPYTGQEAMDLKTNLIDGTVNSLSKFVQFIYAINN